MAGASRCHRRRSASAETCCHIAISGSAGYPIGVCGQRDVVAQIGDGPGARRSPQSLGHKPPTWRAVDLGGCPSASSSEVQRPDVHHFQQDRLQRDDDPWRDPKPRGDLPPSRWINVTGAARGHYKPVELAEAKQLIDDLLTGSTDRPLTPSDIIVISPFRDVARELSQLNRYFGRNLRAGTVHTAQGKQARVVLLVLGGNPRRPGAKRWAASEPNLVNVAASRAKERLYVIGDEAAWSSHNYFDVMAEALAAETARCDTSSHSSR